MKSFMLALALLAASGTCLAIEMPQAAQDIGCTNCHAIDHKIVGPAWIDIAKRYRDSRDITSVLNTLVDRVSRGGAGNWGSIPMVANDAAGKRHDQIVKLVKFILSLSDQPPVSRGQ